MMMIASRILIVVLALFVGTTAKPTVVVVATAAGAGAAAAAADISKPKVGRTLIRGIKGRQVRRHDEQHSHHRRRLDYDKKDEKYTAGEEESSNTNEEWNFVDEAREGDEFFNVGDGDDKDSNLNMANLPNAFPTVKPTKSPKSTKAPSTRSPTDFPAWQETTSIPYLPPGPAIVEGETATTTSSAIVGTDNTAATQQEQSQSLMTTYSNKCDAAREGAEFRTNSFVEVFYEYELVMSTARNVLEVVDIVDKAVQHFLATWLVDCDAMDINNAVETSVVESAIDGGGERRKLAKQRGWILNSKSSRYLQQLTLAPIVGTGVGDYDTVKLQGNDAADIACTVMVASEMMGQVCYKVIGDVVVYLDESMFVTDQDIQTLTLETLTIGMNYAATDFTQLDPDIYGLYMTQGFGGEPPAAVVAENSETNQRPWATEEDHVNSSTEGDLYSSTEGDSNSSFGAQELSNEDSSTEERSGGAKFGIALATLVCITLFILLCVYMYKNREKLFHDVDWDNFFCFCCLYQPRSQKKHANMDDIDTIDASTEKNSGTLLRDEDGSNGEMTFRTFLRGSSPTGSATTGPLSPEPDSPHGDELIPSTPRHQDEHYPVEEVGQSNVPSHLEESNIYTPQSDRSQYSVARSDFSADMSNMNLSKDAIRRSSRKNKPSRLVSPTRTEEFQDTVDL